MPTLESMRIGQIRFDHVCIIAPERASDCSVVEFMPQERYKNERGLPLNKYGKGPFCKFKIPNDLNRSGVYAITIRGEVKYIGECINLSARYNMGYGNISPRNCFVGGQETNCRINNLVYIDAAKGKDISLWFFATEDYKDVEAGLRGSQILEWNRI